MVTHQFLDAFSWGNISGAAWRVTPNISVLLMLESREFGDLKSIKLNFSLPVQMDGGLSFGSLGCFGVSSTCWTHSKMPNMPYCDGLRGSQLKWAHYLSLKPIPSCMVTDGASFIKLVSFSFCLMDPTKLLSAFFRPAFKLFFGLSWFLVAASAVSSGSKVTCHGTDEAKAKSA